MTRYTRRSRRGSTPRRGFDSRRLHSRATDDSSSVAFFPARLASNLLTLSHCRAAPLREDGVAPHPVQLTNALAPADDAEAALLLQAQAGGVLGKRCALQRPDAM